MNRWRKHSGVLLAVYLLAGAVSWGHAVLDAHGEVCSTPHAATLCDGHCDGSTGHGHHAHHQDTDCTLCRHAQARAIPAEALGGICRQVFVRLVQTGGPAITGAEKIPGTARAPPLHA